MYEKTCFDSAYLYLNIASFLYTVSVSEKF